MRNRAFVVAALGLGAVLVAGVLIASNMGFKASYPLDGADSANSNDGLNTLGLPYFQQTGITIVQDLIDDINLDTPLGTGDTSDNVQSITRFRGDPPDNRFETYSLFTGGTNFTIAAAQGYIVVMRGTLTNYTIVGSHNPALGLNLEDPSSPTSNDGTQDISIPYHFVGTVIEDLIDDINGQGGGDNVQSVSHYVGIPPANVQDTYSLFTGGTNFSIKVGEAYTVVMQAGLANYIPAHY